MQCHEEDKVKKSKEEGVWEEEEVRAEWEEFMPMQVLQDIVYAQNVMKKLRISRESLVILSCVPNADHRC